MRAALLILAKDMKLRARDRSVYLFAVIVPLGLTAIFSVVLPDLQAFSLTAAVVDEDGGDVAAGFVDGVIEALVDDGVLTQVDVADADDARAQVTAGDIDAAWIIPPGFSDRVAAGESAEITVVVNPDRGLASEVATGVAEAYAGRLAQVSLAVATTAVASQGQLDEEALAAIAAEVAASDAIITLGPIDAEVRELDPTTYLAAGMAVFFVFFAVQFGVTGLLEERQQGTLPRLLSTPIATFSVPLGKALGAFVIGIGSMITLVIGSTLALGAEWGPPLGVAILVVAVVIAALGVMALTGSFARTAEQASNFQAIVAVLLGMLGGVFFPIASDATVLRLLSLSSPHGWFLRGLGDLAGGGWSAVLPAAAAMVAFGIVAAIPAVLRTRTVMA